MSDPVPVTQMSPQEAALMIARMEDLVNQIKTSKVATSPGAQDSRGRGLEHDAWVVEFHYTCPDVNLIANAGRLYAFCPGHRCLALAPAYETSVRTQFTAAMALEMQTPESDPVFAKALAERKRRASL